MLFTNTIYIYIRVRLCDATSAFLLLSALGLLQYITSVKWYIIVSDFSFPYGNELIECTSSIRAVTS